LAEINEQEEEDRKVQEAKDIAVAQVKEKLRLAEVENARVEAEWMDRLALSQDAIKKMNYI